MFKNNSKIKALIRKRENIRTKLNKNENKISSKKVNLENIQKKVTNCKETIDNLTNTGGGLQKEIDSKRRKLSENVREKERLNSQLNNKVPASYQ